MNIACTLWQQVVQLAHFSVHMHRNFYLLAYLFLVPIVQNVI